MGGKKYIGRGIEAAGLGALLDTTGLNSSGTSSLNEIDLKDITANPNQPRTIFDEESLEELATSIRNVGIIQPITLKEISDGKYMIISGERRFRAAEIAGLARIPAYIKTVEDDNVMEMALIENIQREDLNAIETALAYQTLMDKSGQTQEQLSERVGKKRATISNYLRLLKLPAEIQMGIKNKTIDMGHARALLSIADPEIQISLYERITKENLSVRAVEDIARKINESGEYQEKKNITGKSRGKILPEEFKMLKEHLSKFFETKVQMSYNEGKGKITIPFDSDDTLAHIMELFDQMR